MYNFQIGNSVDELRDTKELLKGLGFES